MILFWMEKATLTQYEMNFYLGERHCINLIKEMKATMKHLVFVEFGIESRKSMFITY